jgi:hypothetical protein
MDGRALSMGSKGSKMRIGRILRAMGCGTLALIIVASVTMRSQPSRAATDAPAVSMSTTNAYPGASHVPDSQAGWQKFLNGPDADAPLDEAQGGKTARGTPISPRPEDCFPAETRNLFSLMDQVPTGPNGKLEPFAWGKSAIDQKGRDGIRGQNTWVLWGEGNEAFWGWLQEQGYGLVDFMVMLDSRKRDTRFRDTGVMNQPGMKSSNTPILGLYLDEADGDAIKLQQPATDIEAETGQLARRPEPPARGDHPSQLFEPGDAKLYAEVLARLPKDGVDYTVYGYPSGVVGLRLMPNPDFFGNTPDAARARQYWDEKVVKPGSKAYYDRGTHVQADPDLVRPFRVTMSCGFCHIGPHPLNPPANPEKPGWENMSSTIGNQYWTPPALFANLTAEDSLLYQFLASQQPGTVDTSLVSTDHINNANTITAVFDMNARLARAMENSPEVQSQENLTFRGLEDGDRKISPRHTPRVLIDGADSIGAFGALSRVYLNIGTFPEEWARCHNPIIGFKPQRPFPVTTLQANSVFWRTADRYRIPYLVEFFTHHSARDGRSIVAPMKLAATAEGRNLVTAEHDLAGKGREVFLRNCAMCHSSKQPEGFALEFSDDWAKHAAPPADDAHFVVPRKFEDWEAFRASAAFRSYGDRITAQAGAATGDKDPFLEDNFLSTDIRIPITLVGTNSGRSVGTNGMRGQVWDNFSSEDYKSLPAVGGVRFFNPYSGVAQDAWNNNDTYYPPPGGPGYYRPASLISLWATAPYLHNNALGLFNRDPSVAGRLQAFDDGIDKLLSQDKRKPAATAPYGDLRLIDSAIGQSDPGFIYRVAQDSSIYFAAKFVPRLLGGVVGSAGVSFLTVWLWAALAVVTAILAVWGRARIAGFALLLFAIVAAVVLVLMRLDRVWPWLWAAPAVLAALAVWCWRVNVEQRWAARVLFGLLFIGSIFAGNLVHRYAAGELGPVDVGPIPRGVPINLVMNMNPEAPKLNLLHAVAGITRGILLSQRESDPDRRRVVFEREAGPALLSVSKCPDFVLDRGHWFGEHLTVEEKAELKAFLKTL